ncbi:hypothetical protein ACHWQZ_G010258 [Mnemiopsis leidyi]
MLDGNQRRDLSVNHRIPLVDLSAGFYTNAIYKPAALQLVTSEATAAVQILDILQLNLLSAMKEESLGERLIF